MKKILIFSFICIFFTLTLQGCGNNNTANNTQEKTTDTKSISATNEANLGLTTEEFIVSYNKVLDNIIKQGHSNANYYKIDVNKVKDNTIVLDGIATLSWHLNGGYIDAIAETVPNPLVGGLNISEMAIIVAITKNKETLNTIIDRINANEKKVALNQGGIFILRQSDIQLKPSVKGTSLVVCTNEYRNKLMEAVKAKSKENQNGTSTLQSRDTSYLDLTDNDLKNNDIFSDEDYRTLEKIPKVDFSANAMGLTLKEFEKMIDCPMVEASHEAMQTLFVNYYAIGLDKNQCKDITFYQRVGDTGEQRFKDIVGIKNGIVVIYVGMANIDEAREIIKNLDTEPLQVQYDYGSSYFYWKGNNCYIALIADSMPGEPVTFENMKRFYNSYEIENGVLIQYLGDMHYSKYFKIGTPMNTKIGGN